MSGIMMKEKCNCPICRFHKKELSVSDIAWYLKGSIEQQNRYVNLIENSNSLDELKAIIKYDRYNVDENLYLLEDIKHNKNINPDGWWDPALDKPKNFC